LAFKQAMGKRKVGAAQAARRRADILVQCR
jgi:hypothetical protein